MNLNTIKHFKKKRNLKSTNQDGIYTYRQNKRSNMPQNDAS